MITGQIFLLLGHEARLAIRDWLAASGARRRVPAFLSWSILGLLWGGLSWVAALGLREAGTVDSPLVLAIISSVLLFASTLMLAQAISTAVETIYVRADLDFLFSAPISPVAVLGVRMAGLALRVAVFWLAVSLGAALFALAAGDARWVGLPLAVLGLALMAVGGGLLLAEALFRLLGAKRARGVGQVVSGVMGASIAIGVQVFNVSRRRDSPEQWAEQLQAFSAALPSVQSPLWTPARAFTPDIPALAIWLLATGLLFIWAAFRFARRYGGAAAAAASLRTSTRRLTAAGAFTGGVLRAGVRKELRLLVRNPLLISALLLPFLYFLAPMGAAFASNFSARSAPLIGALVATLVVWISTSTVRGLTGLAMLTEEAPDLVAAAPVDARRLQLAKLLAALVPVGAVATAGFAALAFLSIKAALAGLIGSAVAATSAGLVAVRRGKPRPRKDLRAGMTVPKLPIAVTVAGGFATTAYVSAVGLAVSPAWPAAIIPALIGAGLTLSLLDEGDSTETPSNRL